MGNQGNRYKDMERMMTYALIGDGVMFLVYLVAAITGVIWLKVVAAIIAFLVSGLCLCYLYFTKELLKPRSLWMTTAASAVILCTFFSLILNFPS